MNEGSKAGYQDYQTLTDQGDADMKEPVVVLKPNELDERTWHRRTLGDYIGLLWKVIKYPLYIWWGFSFLIGILVDRNLDTFLYLATWGLFSNYGGGG